MTEFQDGILPWALARPVALVLDEYDAGRPDVMFVIQRLMERDGRFTLLDQNRVLQPHPGFRLRLPVYAPHVYPLAGDDPGSFRGAADGVALRLTGSDHALYRRVRPEDAAARLVFELLEQFRVRTDGAAPAARRALRRQPDGSCDRPRQRRAVPR